ncbi:TonB-dependent receptor plug domain-containing protein [Paraburkholderia phosphatilytica]|uniref:TonB-dependent receptor plug domain-containing protein n=1 Tax=Paraburkholderia phosphatilytica TaxID=2282883 RepID=UPI000E4D90EE|nr:TonB-dependent receptor [Paraburkholderia phosphatilytica]
MPLESLMTMTVSSATRVAQPISSAPATVVVLTAADIREYGWRTLADALATIPGLYTASDRTYTYLGARGFQRPGDYNSRFLLLIDGMRVNDAVYDQAPIGADFPLDMDLVERIEYVAGPGSAVYGSNALFGVINVITKSGKDIGGAQVAAAGGSFGEKRGRATYGWHGANGADVVLSASAYEKNGQDLYYPEFDTPDQNNGIAQNLDYERAQNLFAKFAYEGFRLSVGYGNRTKGVPDAPYGAVFDAPFSVTDTHSFVDATWHQALREDVALDYELYWGRYDYRSPELDGPPPGTENMDGDHAMWYGGDVHATITTFARNRIVAGVDFTRDANRDQFNYNVAPYQLLLDDHRSSDMAGVYAEDQITLLDSLSLDLGVRYDAESNMGGNVNPRVALIYRPTSRDTFKAIYGTAYRAPNAYEMYYAVPGDGGQEANPSLGAEHIATEELVYERAIGASGRATLSLFRYTLRDLITETTDPATGLFVFENVDRAEAKGAELAYEQSFAGGVRVRASYSYQMSRDSGSGAALQDSPRHMGKLNAVIPLFHERGWFGGEMQCLSSRLSEFGEAGGYCIGNVTIGSRKLLDHADVSFSIYNVTDRHYSDPAGPGFIQDTIVQQSRTFLLKVVYGF